MSFIKSFSINTNKQQPFPFNIPAVRFAKNIVLDKINIFIGDNCSDKSTLPETIAYAIDLPLIGGHIKDVKDFEAVRRGNLICSLTGNVIHRLASSSGPKISALFKKAIA